MASLQAFFLPLGQGTRFCLLHEPRQDAMRRGAVLFVHAFAEELNLCRPMAARQARAWADAGWSVLQVDLFGCGDSEGDFGDASWQRWLDDISAAAAWLREKTGCAPVLWGLRAGCLLCVQAAARMDAVPRLVLWQPVLSGKQHLQQFLRLKLAHQLIEGATDERTGTQQLREQLARGETIEVAGYALSPALALPLEASELAASPVRAPIAWLEVTGAAGRALAPASRACIERMQASGARLEARAVEGPAFWQNPESGDCPALIESTLALIQTG